MIRGVFCCIIRETLRCHRACFASAQKRIRNRLLQKRGKRAHGNTVENLGTRQCRHKTISKTGTFPKRTHQGGAVCAGGLPAGVGRGEKWCGSDPAVLDGGRIGTLAGRGLADSVGRCALCTALGQSGGGTLSDGTFTGCVCHLSDAPAAGTFRIDPRRRQLRRAASATGSRQCRHDPADGGRTGAGRRDLQCQL